MEASRSTDSISTSLIERIQSSDQTAWIKLVKLYGPLIQYWAKQSGLSENDAADVGQEVFTTVHRRINDFKREQEGDTFRGWLRTITRFKIADLMRARYKSPQAEGGTDAMYRLQQAEFPEKNTDHSSVEEACLAKQGLQLIRHEFTEKTWNAFVATSIDNRPPEVVAQELNMSIGAVYIARSRVLKRLREELSNIE